MVSERQAGLMVDIDFVQGGFGGAGAGRGADRAVPGAGAAAAGGGGGGAPPPALPPVARRPPRRAQAGRRPRPPAGDITCTL